MQRLIKNFKFSKINNMWLHIFLVIIYSIVAARIFLGDLNIRLALASYDDYPAAYTNYLNHPEQYPEDTRVGLYAVGVLTQFILAWRVGWGPGSDAPYLNGLRRDARRYGKYQGKRTPSQVHVFPRGYLADARTDGRLTSPALPWSRERSSLRGFPPQRGSSQAPWLFA